MTDIVAPVRTEITNFSALSPNRFRVVINLFPQLSFFAQKVVLPGITMGQNTMPTNKNLQWSTPGDTLHYDDLVISFMIDEDMIAYRILKKWQEEMTLEELPGRRFSDLSIMVMTNNSTNNLEYRFMDTYPVLMSGLLLDTAQDENVPFTVDVSFKHSHFEIRPEIDYELDPDDVGKSDENI